MAMSGRTDRLTQLISVVRSMPMKAMFPIALTEHTPKGGMDGPTIMVPRHMTAALPPIHHAGARRQ